MGAGDGTHDGQAEARAAKAAPARSLGPPEPVEGTGLIFRAQARPGIATAKDHLIAFGPGLDMDLTLRRIAAAVFQHRDTDLTQPRPVGHDPGRRESGSA